MRCFIDDCIVGKDGDFGVDYNMCWIGLMVVDVYCILKCGGVFFYLCDVW